MTNSFLAITELDKKKNIFSWRDLQTHPRRFHSNKLNENVQLFRSTVFHDHCNKIRNDPVPLCNLWWTDFLLDILSLQIFSIIKNRRIQAADANSSPATLIWDYTKITWKSDKMRAITFLESRECIAAQRLSRCSSPMELNSTVVSHKIMSFSINHVSWLRSISSVLRRAAAYVISIGNIHKNYKRDIVWPAG